jgi:hypothetical protein
MDFLLSIFSFFTGGGDGGGHTRPSGPILD